MSSKKKVQDTLNSEKLKHVHSAMTRIVSFMSRPQVDERMVREAGIALDRALFPLLVSIDRLAPIGVIDLAEHIGRDYTTVSRQVAKLESLGLVKRRAGEKDGRVREALMTEQGKAMTDAVNIARERIGRAIFEQWDEREFDELVRLLQKFVGDIEHFAASDPAKNADAGA
jgi:DNA-binding MarR family transcriptional regulator